MSDVKDIRAYEQIAVATAGLMSVLEYIGEDEETRTVALSSVIINTIAALELCPHCVIKDIVNAIKEDSVSELVEAGGKENLEAAQQLRTLKRLFAEEDGAAQAVDAPEPTVIH